MHEKNQKQRAGKEKQTTSNLHTADKKLSKKQKKKQKENEMKAKLLREKGQKQAIREEKKVWAELRRLGEIADVTVSPTIAGGDEAATENVRMSHPSPFIPSPASFLPRLPMPDTLRSETKDSERTFTNFCPPYTCSILRPIKPNRHRSRLLRARPR